MAKYPKRPIYCTDCGKEVTEDQVRPDPYRSEIYDDYTPVPICDECYDKACEDI